MHYIQLLARVIKITPASNVNLINGIDLSSKQRKKGTILPQQSFILYNIKKAMSSEE